MHIIKIYIRIRMYLHLQKLKTTYKYQSHVKKNTRKFADFNKENKIIIMNIYQQKNVFFISYPRPYITYLRHSKIFDIGK